MQITEGRRIIDNSRIKLETYEHLTMVNRYLFGEMEACTAMINYLKSNGVDTSELRDKRFRIKQMVDLNLSKLEVIWKDMEARNG